MKFTVQDTASTYRKIIAEKDAEKKKAMFKDDLLNPYEGLFNAFGGSLNPKPGQMDAAMFLQGWSFLLPPQLDEKALKRLEVMEKYHAWDLMAETLDRPRRLSKSTRAGYRWSTSRQASSCSTRRKWTRPTTATPVSEASPAT